MTQEHSSIYCPHCKAQVLAVRDKPNHTLHFLITIFALGAWLVPWAGMSMAGKKWRCTRCGQLASPAGAFKDFDVTPAMGIGVAVAIFLVLSAIFLLSLDWLTSPAHSG